MFVFVFCFLGPHPWHMEVPRLGVKSELLLPTYSTATAMSDLSGTHTVAHSNSRLVPDPMSEARDQTCILMDTSPIHFHCATMGTPSFFSFFFFVLLSFCHFLGRFCDTWRFPGWGSNRSPSHQPMPKPQQHGIRAESATYTTAHGNAGSLTH